MKTMRIEIFRLPAFGPFTDREVRFANQGSGLHVIHGLNEAGKSTMLRALNNLLFGFPHQTPDAYLHPARSLSVGASLRLTDGSNLDIVRFKRRKNDLLDGTGQVLAQSDLAALMGGISQDLFGRIFSMDQDGLRQGAEGLLQAEGDLGQALFAAASGIANLRGILKDLETRQDSLFRPRASTSSIHRDISELSALSRQVRELSLKPSRWKKLRQELRTLQEQQKDLLDALFALDTNMARLQRYRGALRHIDLREEISRRLAGIEETPLLADDFTERRSKAQQALVGAVQEEERLVFRLEQIQSQLKTITLNTGLLEVGNEIQRLHVETAAHRKALKDIRGLETRCAGLRSAIADKLESLGRDPALEQDQKSARVTRQLKVHLESLAREYGALNADLVSASQARDDFQADLAELGEQLEAMPPLPDTSPLETALARAADMGHPVQRLQEIAAGIEKLRSSISRDMEAMGLWQGDPAELECLALPLPETLDRFDTDLQAADISLKDVQKDKQRLESALAEKSSALQRLELTGELPNPSVLAAVRTLRNTGWSLIKNAWLLGEIDPHQEALFTEQISGAGTLAEAFEQSLHQTDSLADAMFANASSVAQALGLRQEITSLKQAVQNNAAQIQAETLALEDLQKLWAAQWRPAGISPLSPREMQAWLTKALDVRQRLADLRERESSHQRLVREMQAMAAELGQALADAGEVFPEQTEYAAVLSLAGKSLARLQQRAAKQQDLLRRRREVTRARDKAALRRDQAAAALDAWNEQWAKALQPLALPADTTPEVAAAVALTLEEIAQAKREMDDLERRVADMDDEYRAFSRQVLKWKHLLCSEAPERPEDVIGFLHAHWQAEKEKMAQVEALTKEQRLVEQQLHAARTTFQACQKTLSALCAEAGCAKAEELPACEARARAKAQALNDRDRVEEQLLELAGGENLDAFIAAAREYQPDELTAELERMRIQKTELNEQRDGCTAEIGRLRGELAGLDGASRAAEVAQQVSDVQARLEESVRQFVLLRLASQVLSREIERYREANQGPVLEAASRFFATMTVGSFSGLLADYDEKGDPVIKAVRDADQRLEIGQLSEGSRDQLFLALRLGGLWRYLQANPPCPLIVDDILVNFDDQRSAATFRVLHEIAATTQVLFFTHHAHLVDIARQTLSEGMEVVELTEDEKLRR